MKVRLSATTLAVFLALAAGSVGIAQVTTATFYGSVTDSSRAVLPGANVTMTHEGTGATITKLTDERGEFAFTFLQTGAYTLKIEMLGFKTHVSPGFGLGAAQSVRQTFALEVGAVADEVTVTSEAPLVNTVAADQRQSYSRLQITELPLRNRDFAALLTSSTGVSTGGTNIRMNGMGGAGTRVTVDGTEATAFSEGSGTVMFGSFNKIGLVGLDAVGEVQTTKGIIAAEYAATLSGNVNVMIRSGTNEWHGSVFENYTGAALNARHQTATSKPNFTFNQFGGSIGGPIRRDKIFIFGTYEGYREAGKQVQQGNVPTERLRNLMIAAVPDYKLYVDTIFPLPNQPHDPNGVIGRFIGTASRRLDENHATVKTDMLLAGNSTLTVGYSRSRPNEYAYQLTLNPVQRNGKQERVNASYVIGRASWTSETRAGYNYASWIRVDDLIYIKDPKNPDERLRAGRRLPTIEGLNFFAPDGEVQAMGGATWTFEHKISKVVGKHVFKLGGIYATRGTGRETYDNPEITYANERDLLANIPNNTEIGFGQNRFNVYLPEWGLFAQDDWRISPKLTLNLGLRYDNYRNPVYKEKDPKSPAVANTFAGILDPYNFIYGPLRPENNPVDPDYLNFGPRFGFAYNPDGQAKSVIRGGLGVMFAPRNNSVFASVSSPSLTMPAKRNFTRAEMLAYGFRYPTYNDDVEAVVLAENKIVLDHILEPKYVAPYVMNVYLGMQRALTDTVMLETAFVGNRGVKFPLLRWFNQIDRVTGLRPNQELPYEGSYYDSSQTTLYSSLQSSLRSRFSDNLLFNVHHTWAKGLAYIGGNAAGWFSGDISRTAIQDFNNWKNNRSPVTGDLNHVVSADWVYEFPALANVNPGLRQVLGGWQVSGIFRAQTGAAVDVTQLSSGGPTSRPDIIDIKNMYVKDYETTAQYLNPAAFAMVPVSPVSRVPMRPGTAGFRAVRGPGEWNVDFALGKNFSLREDLRLQFRVDMFNALNHTNLGNPISSINNSEFGKITTTGGARTIQAHARLSF